MDQTAVPSPQAPSPQKSPLVPGVPPTPWSWRLAIGMTIVALAVGAYALRELIGVRGQSAVGIVFFFGLVALFSANLRAVNWRTIACGFALQVLLAVLVLKVEAVEDAFQAAGKGVNKFVNFADEGSRFVFGNIGDARPPDKDGTWIGLFGPRFIPQLAFIIGPTILFVSAFFTMLYHLGILQWCVRFLARIMVYVMGTSGAETLSVSANVFMGMTEAPLIVKPYVPRMTNSELFTLMVSGFAHISGGMMVLYISYGADAAAVLTTCVMACPGSLYLAKLFLPETSVPETAGSAHTQFAKSPHVNTIDAIAAGTTDGLRLALNVIAMLIVFVAFVAMIDALLAGIKPGLLGLGINSAWLEGWPDELSLKKIFGWIFEPAAFLMGVESDDAPRIGSLLGIKLSLNEHVAYQEMKKFKELYPEITARSYKLAAFALTGFANFGSVGIQLGGIGALAPDRRHDLARLGGRALFVGFVATLLNAAIAGVLL